MVRISWGLYLLARTARCLHFTIWPTIWGGPGPVFSEIKKGQHLGRSECGGGAELAPRLLPPEEHGARGGVPQGAKLTRWLSVLLHSTLPPLSDDASLR